MEKAADNAMISFLQRFGKLPEDVTTAIQRNTVQQELPRKTLLLRAGRVCDHLYFLEKGLARNYSENGEKTYTNDIVVDGELLASFASFVSRLPSEENIELLEDSKLYSLHYDQLQQLYAEYPYLERIGRLIAERNYISLASQTYRLRFLNSAERYENLITRKPEIIKRTPIGVIASYLGMSIETLSRIRGKEV